MSFDDFFKRVSRLTGISTQKDLANILGLDPSAITMAKVRGGVPKFWVLTLADRLGVNPEWLRTGKGSERIDNHPDIALIPRVSAKACAGGGSLDVSDCVIDKVPFERAWLTKKGNPDRMVVMGVVGDSMSPEIEPGDMILIDQDQNQAHDNNIYVVGINETVQIKRLQSRPDLVILFSANPRYSPVTLQGDEIDTLRIIGRVLWSSRNY